MVAQKNKLEQCVVGIDLGGTKLLAGVMHCNGCVQDELYQEVSGLSANELIQALVGVVQRFSSVYPIVGVGLGVPSLIDQQRGVAVTTVNLPLTGVPIRQLIEQQVGLPVVIENDANAAAFAEWKLGVGKGHENLVVLTVGTGIGGGLVVNNQLVRGALGAAGELGHTVIDQNGPPCQGSCPNNGCLETMASGTALTREANVVADANPGSTLALRRVKGDLLDGKLLLALAQSGDASACGLFDLIGRRLGIGIANFVNMLNPDLVVVGGGVVAAGELLLAPARAELKRRALSPSREHAKIVSATFGAQAGMLGAGLLAADQLGDASARK